MRQARARKCQGVMPLSFQLFLEFQDISHVFASVFKDLYTKDIIGKDTVSNLVKTKSGRSTFARCVDNDLLKKHNLIAPQDYLPTPKPQELAAKPNQTKARPKWKGEPSAKDRAEGWETLQKLKDRSNFLRNPRFLPPNAQQGGMSLIRDRAKVKTEPERKCLDHTEDPVPVFYRHVRVIPPTTPYFSIGLGRFPGEGGVVAPGMSCKYTLRFAPDSLADYKDFIMVESQAQHQLWCPLRHGDLPPILTLPSVLDCGYCLVGGVKLLSFCVKMLVSALGHFASSQEPLCFSFFIQSVAKTSFSEQPPFAVSPSLFVLQPGEVTVMEVVFFPTTEEKSCQVFTVVCDNCQVKDISIEGKLIALELLSVSGETEPLVVGEVHDLTAEHFVRFSPCNPHSMQQKKVVIRNNVHLEFPFHWQVMKPNLHPLVSPVTGLLAPCEDQEFLLTFCPTEVKKRRKIKSLLYH
uniref:Deleted in lung and esophageal cancer protein 1 Ig-like domain-containing protein n=1 Tax=Amphiprion percula TaxID=161767 RepID=A0A3P8TID1_AMPPE